MCDMDFFQIDGFLVGNAKAKGEFSSLSTNHALSRPCFMVTKRWGFMWKMTHSDT